MNATDQIGVEAALDFAGISKGTAEQIRFSCGKCGKVWLQTVEHYDIIECKCRNLVWALRPDRHGPLVCFQHPGFAERTRIERHHGKRSQAYLARVKTDGAARQG